MKRSAVPTAVLVAAFALVALLVYGVVQNQKGGSRTLDDDVNAGQLPNAPDPNRALPMLGDDAVKKSVASYRGKVVVLNFWASWCDPCEAEAPVLRRAQERLAKNDTGTVLGATYQDAPSDSEKFLRENKLSWPNVRDVGTKLAHEYGTVNIPETFVLDRKGRVVSISRGQISESFLTKAIDKAERS